MNTTTSAKIRTFVPNCVFKSVLERAIISKETKASRKIVIVDKDVSALFFIFK